MLAFSEASLTWVHLPDQHSAPERADGKRHAFLTSTRAWKSVRLGDVAWKLCA